VGQLLDDLRGHRVVTPARTVVAQRLEVAVRGLATRHGEAGETVLLETQLDLASSRDLARRGDALFPRLTDEWIRVRRARRKGTELRF
jgi:hypothetical protein